MYEYIYIIIVEFTERWKIGKWRFENEDKFLICFVLTYKHTYICKYFRFNSKIGAEIKKKSPGRWVDGVAVDGSWMMISNTLIMDEMNHFHKTLSTNRYLT